MTSPFGIKVPPKGAHDFRQSSAAAKNGSCNDSNFRGLSRLSRSRSSPALPGHRPAFIGGFRVSGLLTSPNQRDSRHAQETPEVDSRQRRSRPGCANRAGASAPLKSGVIVEVALVQALSKRI